MTSYVTPTELRQILSPDADPTADTSSASSMSDAELQEAIDEAQTEVDAKLAARYTVPFSSIPPIVEKLTRDIAAWLATLVFRRGDPIDPNDPVQLRYNRAQANLLSIQSGKTELTTTTGPVSEDTAVPEVVNQFDGDLFTPDDFALGPAPNRGVGYPFTQYDDGQL